MPGVTLEESICALEAALGVSITVVDNAGIFHTPQGVSIFNRERQSHRKNAVCAAGFSDACVEHCRYEMNSKCQRLRSPFAETCWKGVTEIVIPLAYEGIHYGMLYAGSWRSSTVQPPKLPAAFTKAYAKLPRQSDTCRDIMNILAVFSDGIMLRLKEMHTLDVHPDSRGSRVMAYIGAHAAEEIQLADIAAELRLSKTRTSVLIHRIFGTSLPALVAGERIKRVQALLATTDSTLARIAAATGFCDEYHLSRIFRKNTGLTPGVYRKRHRIDIIAPR
ncbi:MAG: helix-turn-helix domain-containing protein [Spirochaetes bacterium]|nr:helix-turn-helix domain-containing protein [Spirochaetota bacterium]